MAQEDVERTMLGQTGTGRTDTVECLVMVSGEDPGRRIYLDRPIVLGRGKDCNAMLLGDGGVSRRHACVIRNDDGTIQVEDLQSRNGTRVNGRQISERTDLEVGDEIELGERTVFTLAHRDRFEDNLLVAQKMQALGQLAGGIAHDFNNILGALFANISFLGSKEHDDETTECLGEMEAAVRRAIDLTNQLLGFGRKTTVEHRSIRVATLLSEGADLLRRTLPRNIDIEAEISPRLHVAGDPARLLQVVMNLSINAKDAMPRGGTLRITAEPVELPHDRGPLTAGRYVAIAFADTGEGIDPGNLRRIFEPFFTTKPRGQGTGLGLATVQAIARDHGGSIEVDSEVGRGTRFIVYLRSAEATRRNTMVGSVVDTAPQGRVTGLVLVADDDDLVRASIVRVLRREGAEVITASDGAEALRRYAERASELRLIILDVDMPRVDGTEVLKVLRSFESELPVIVVSGHVAEERTRAVRELGISELLPKPFGATTLLDAVRRHIGSA